MDLLVMRAIGRGLQIIAAIGMIIYGIVILSRNNDDEKFRQRGRTYIWIGVLWLAFVIYRLIF